MPQAQMCWANLTLQKVEKWEGPVKFGDCQEARVSYTYLPSQTAGWAQREDIQALSNDLRASVQNADPRKAALNLKLTSEGWEVIRK